MSAIHPFIKINNKLNFIIILLLKNEISAAAQIEYATSEIASKVITKFEFEKKKLS